MLNAGIPSDIAIRIRASFPGALPTDVKEILAAAGCEVRHAVITGGDVSR